MSVPLRAAVVATVLFSISICAALGDSITLGAIKDNTLYEEPEGALSDGAGSRMFAGVTGVDFKRRAVIAFNVAASVPAGATISSVSLRLNMSRTTAPGERVVLYRLLANWGQGTSDATSNEGGGAASTPNDATWIHTFYPSSFWTTPGGDFSTTASASQNVVGTGPYTWGPAAQMTADVQDWLNNSATNFGWIIIGNETEIHTAKRFDTREALTVANRPSLTINYSLAIAPIVNPIPSGSTACGSPFSSSAPTLAQGTQPITWSLMNGPGGMTINPGDGAVSWPNPLAAVTPYTVTVRATNTAGNDTESWLLTVLPGDFNGDGIRDDADVSDFADHLLGILNVRPCAADVNLDGFMDGLDIAAWVGSALGG